MGYGMRSACTINSRFQYSLMIHDGQDHKERSPMIKKSKPVRVAIYARVSTDEQTTENQERELREIAERGGWEIVETYRDAGISGAKGRDDRPAFDALCKDATRRRFDLIMAWSVDRLGRSLQDIVA